MSTLLSDNQGVAHGHSKTTVEQFKERQAQLNDRLTAIYQNEAGELPDMHHITIRHSHFWLKTLILILFLGVIGSGATWLYIATTPSSGYHETAQAVTVTINGPTLVDYGKPALYTITYTNKRARALTKASLALRFPTGFVLTKSSLPTKKASKNEWDLGSIEPGETGTLTVTGITYGTNRDNRSWRAFLNYQGESLNTEVQETASFETTIVNNPYNVSMTGPATVAPGMDALYTFTLTTNQTAFDTDMELTPSWPEYFSITSSSPQLSKTARWVIPKNTTSSSLQFEVHGRFTPNTEKNAALKANLVAVLPSSNQTFTVNTASFTTEQTAGAANGLALAINGSGSVTTAASPGELLTMTFAIKNTSATLIKDGVAQLIFQAPSIKRQSIINWAKLIDASNGDLRGEQISTAIRQASLTWNKKNLPQLGNLAPGEETSITLSVPVKNTETFDLSSIKERTIAITGGLTFTDASGTIQTLPLNRRLVSLGSDIAFEQRDVVTKDTNQAEVHTITWVASHSFGDLKKVKITAEVFPDVVFTQTVPASAGIASFDPATKKLSWTIPDLPESVDVLAWTFALNLTTKNPSQNTLVSKVTIEAEDEFGHAIQRESPALPLSNN
jgi:hypothetical protein